MQVKNTLTTLRFVHWSNRSYVLNNLSLEYRLCLANCDDTRPFAGINLLSMVVESKGVGEEERKGKGYCEFIFKK